MSVIDVSSVKDRLNKSLSVDDGELQDMLDAAEAEYAALVGPLSGKTLRFDGGGRRLILPVNATAVTAVSYTDGRSVDVADLDFDPDAGILHSRGFTAGSRNVIVSFTVDLPDNHREAIIADVAGYFAATQRGTGSAGPRLPGEGYVDAYDAPGTPLTLFPRIRALAAGFPSIA